MPITATIRDISRVSDGCVVVVEFSDGSKDSFDFTPVPSNLDVRARVKGEVDRRNTIDTQINRLRNLINQVID